MTEEKYCDLHIHTKYSDGERSVSDLLAFAKEIGLEKLSITDHDCVSAYFELETSDIRKNFDGQILIGCEFFCQTDGVPIEILGYGFDFHKMKPYLDENGWPQSRMDRLHCQHITNVCKMFGVETNFDYDSSYTEVTSPIKLRSYFYDIIKQPKFYNALFEIDSVLVESHQNFLRLGLNNPLSPIYQNDIDSYPTAEQVIEQIHSLGGLAFVAHPYQYGYQMMNVLENLKDKVDGIECYHFTCSTEERQKVLKDFCKKHNLMSSGGSDYHFVFDKKHHLKDRLNQFKVPQEYFDKIVENVKYEKPLI